MSDKWTVDMVSGRLEEAVTTLKRLPPIRAHGYFNLWPDIMYHPNELLFQEARPIRLRAAPDAISRLEATFGWMMWINVAERKLLWKRSAKVRWKSICWELGCNRSTAYRKWHTACEKIVQELNRREP